MTTSDADYANVTVALSVRQPWAWLIVAGYKDIENRTWPTNFRGRVLIHAGKKFGAAEKREAEAIADKFGIAIPVDFLSRGGIVGGVQITDCVTQSKSPWFQEGGYGFILRGAVVLPFRPIAGRLGFFNIQDTRRFSVKEAEQ